MSGEITPSKSFVTPIQSKTVPRNHISFSKSLDISPPKLDYSNWSDIMFSKTDQIAKLTAAKNMNIYYTKKIEEMKQSIKKLNQQGESTLSILENLRNDLVSRNEYLVNTFESNPPIDLMEEQLRILQGIKQQYSIDIIDEQPFYDIGLLQENDDITHLPKRINQLLKQLAPKQKSNAFYPFGFSTHDTLTMKEAMLKRRYNILKQTTEGSIKKAINERENIKKEISELKARLEKEQSYQSFKRRLDSISG